MYSIRLLASAERDLEAIWSYTVSEWGEVQAKRYISGLRGFLEKIAAFPHLGKSYRPIAGVHVAAHQRHRVVYRPISDGIEVIRLIHQARHFDLVLDHDALSGDSSEED